eukprot:498621-Rhodomonas_salina.4
MAQRCAPKHSARGSKERTSPREIAERFLLSPFVNTLHQVTRGHVQKLCSRAVHVRTGHRMQ